MATKAAPVAEAPPAEPPQPPAKGKKRLILIAAAAALVVVLAGGGATTWWLLKKDGHTEASEDGTAAEHDDEAVAEAKPKKKKDDKKHAPVFLPLDMFTVNLADREAERYAQVGVTLELSDSKTGDTLKAYMPAVRNDILMLLAHKKASELQERSGKLALAREIRQAAMKPLADDSDDKEADEESPVRAVHFSSFIIQ
jgi:flagellar FliL protein